MEMSLREDNAVKVATLHKSILTGISTCPDGCEFVFGDSAVDIVESGEFPTKRQEWTQDHLQRFGGSMLKKLERKFPLISHTAGVKGLMDFYLGGNLERLNARVRLGVDFLRMDGETATVQTKYGEAEAERPRFVHRYPGTWRRRGFAGYHTELSEKELWEYMDTENDRSYGAYFLVRLAYVSMKAIVLKVVSIILIDNSEHNGAKSMKIDRNNSALTGPPKPKMVDPDADDGDDAEGEDGNVDDACKPPPKKRFKVDADDDELDVAVPSTQVVPGVRCGKSGAADADADAGDDADDDAMRNPGLRSRTTTTKTMKGWRRK